MKQPGIPTPSRNSAAQTVKFLASLGLGIAAAWLFSMTTAGPDFRPHRRAFASLGEYAADEVYKLAPRGRVQLVYDVPNKAAEKNRHAAGRIGLQGVQAAAFKQRLASLGKYSFLPDVQLARSPLAMHSEWPAGRFQKLLATPDTTLVLFSSLPTLDAAPPPDGKVIVVGMSLPEVTPAVRSRIVHLAISHRMPIPPGPAETETPEAWARRIYAVMTPESAGGAK